MRKFHLFLYGFIFTVLTIAVFLIGCGGGGGSSTGGGNVCADKSGNVTCGYCSQDALTSNNPNAGKCFYCPSGSSCSGTPCGGITCVTSGTGGGGGCSSGSCMGNDGKCYGSCSTGYCTTSPSGSCSEPSPGGVYCCTAAGGGGDGGGGGGGGTGGSCSSSSVRCDGSLECSQVVTVGSCSVQSCSCYTQINGSDSILGWYRANGVYYCCDIIRGGTASCVAAAQRVANACGGSLPW